ncbi:MAG: hypothetical protein M0T84_16980 [Betaproteobacteria bacterium]|nr:hypothetical protein [Betaproteobacteria bacterium]
MVIVIVVAVAVYWPGIRGPFLFDDFSNLALLGEHGPIDNLHHLIRYLLSGFSGPLGRPVSMAAFLLDDNTWPSIPAPFKYTNILIHALNGVLLCAVLWQFCRALNVAASRAAWVAVIGAGIWFLHPFWVSTTLYVVQRMTLLAATFVFLALMCYLHGRHLLIRGRVARGYAYMTFGLVGCGALAILSKENGALLPVFILVLERYALAVHAPIPEERQHGWRVWRVLFLYLPSLLILGYLATFLPALVAGNAEGRNFTPGQRLLTEGRIVVQYLTMLLVPRPHYGGLFHDDILISRGFFSPPSTMLSWLVIAGLIVGAERSRNRQPMLAVAIMFFLAGHVVESTWIQLQLYFEHRNYLPASFLFLPLAGWIVQTPRMSSRVRIVAVCSILGLLSGETLARANLWGTTFVAAVSWDRAHPDSPLATEYLAQLWMKTGNAAEAERLLQHVLKRHPHDILGQIDLLGAQCAQGVPSNGLQAELVSDVGSQGAADNVTRYQLHELLTGLRSGTCGSAGVHLFERAVSSGLASPATATIPDWRRELYEQRGLYVLSKGNAMQAFDDFRRALAEAPSYQGILTDAAFLASAHQPALALQVIDEFPRPSSPEAGKWGVGYLRAMWLAHIDYYPRQIERLRKIIEGDLQAADKHPATPRAVSQRKPPAAHK